MTLYSIKNWAKHYEKSQTKRVLHASWVPLPVKHDGKGYRRIMALPNGPAIYGAWVLIVQVAAKCTVRGVLADDDGPLSAADLSFKTGCPEHVFAEALQVLSSPDVGWILGARSEHAPSTLGASSNEVCLQDSTEQDNTNTGRDSGACAEVPQTWKKPSVFVGVTAGLLRDAVALSDWHSAAAAKLPRPVVSLSERDRLFVFAAAARALDRSCPKPADNPAALFAWIVANDHRTRPTEAHYEAARRRLKALDESTRYGDRLPRAGPPVDAEAELERAKQEAMKALSATSR